MCSLYKRIKIIVCLSYNKFELQQQQARYQQYQLMLDLVFSIIALIYFCLTPHVADSCFYASIFLNITHIIAHSLLYIPIVQHLLSRGCLSLKSLKKSLIKSSIISNYRMPLFIFLLLFSSLIGLYQMLINLFIWTNYTYLFVTFCCIGSSLTQVCTYVKNKYDCSVYFSVEVYKYFCLAVTCILFGISAHQVKLTAEILGIGWIYFVYRSKQSLPKQIMYYLIMFLDIVILITAISVIASSQSILSQTQKQSNRLRFITSITFYGLLFIKQMYEFIQLYKRLGSTSQFGFESESSITKFYLKMQEYKTCKNIKKIPSNDQKSQHDCSICLENINGNNRNQDLMLKCGHYFHFQCLEEWAYINQTCPMCRTRIVDNLEEGIM